MIVIFTVSLKLTVMELIITVHFHCIAEGQNLHRNGFLESAWRDQVFVLVEHLGKGGFAPGSPFPKTAGRDLTRW
jgi:hypothetical protein